MKATKYASWSAVKYAVSRQTLGITFSTVIKGGDGEEETIYQRLGVPASHRSHRYRGYRMIGKFSLDLHYVGVMLTLVFHLFILLYTYYAYH